MNRIKLPLAAVLFTCVVLLSSAAAFASEGEFPSPSEVSNWLAPDLDSVAAKELAESLVSVVNSDGTRAVQYTTTDIYNLLYSALQGSNYLSVYSLPKIANYTDRIAQILYGSGQSVPTQSLYANLREIHEILNGTTNGVYVRPSIQECLFRTDEDLNFVGVSSDLGNILEMTQLSYAVLNQLHGDGQSNSYYLSQILSAVNDTSDPWTNTGAYYHGAKTSPSGSSLGWTTGLTTAYFGYQFNTNNYINNVPMCLRLFIPWHAWGASGDVSIELTDIIAYTGSEISLHYDESNAFYEPVKNGTYVYLFGFQDIYNGSYPIYFKFAYTGPGSSELNGQIAGSSYFVPFNSDYYQQLKQAFYQQRLTDYQASSPKAQAEAASQPVIQDTLDGFTGNGSAAAKTSDTGAMKNMSGSIQSGLDSGASASNATSVFSNQTFWSWFTQSTSDGINTAYPAPVVQQTRGSGDEIPDFLSGNQAELNDLLNQRNSW